MNTDVLKRLLKTKRMEYAQRTHQNLLVGLYDLIKEYVTNNSIIVEIGSYSGVSSELFALHCKKLFCIDQWQEYKEIKQDKLSNAEMIFVLKELHKQLMKYLVAKILKHIKILHGL